MDYTNETIQNDIFNEMEEHFTASEIVDIIKNYMNSEERAEFCEYIQKNYELIETED